MKVAYICDRKKCDYCSDECKGTFDIDHAKNFMRVHDFYAEVDDDRITRLEKTIETLETITKCDCSEQANAVINFLANKDVK